MSTVRFADIRDSLRDVIQTNNAVLVLGAGASLSSGAPTTQGLTASIRQRFPSAEITPEATLFDAGSEVCDTPSYGRRDLLEYVGSLLSGLQPSDHYKQLPRVRWRGLFTTNYDDLVEKAYTSPGRVQSLQPVAIAYRGKMLPRDNHVELYYLMGSVRTLSDEAAAPVLSWADYHRTVTPRAEVLELFRNAVVDGGKVIYVGYSFGDFLLQTALDAVVKELGGDAPYGYAILRDWPADRRRPVQKISSRNVIPVEGTFEDLAELIREIADGGGGGGGDGQALPSPAAGRTLSVSTGTLRLSESESGVYSEAFEVVHDSLLVEPRFDEVDREKVMNAFFRGSVDLWPAYALGFAFKRPKYEQILETVLSHIDRGIRPDTALLVNGAAGLGKSVLARQLALDVFAKGRVPVALAKARWRTRPDFKLLDRLYDDLEGSLPEGTEAPPLVLIVDDAELLERTIPRRLLSYMKARGRSLLLILFGRTNEFFRPIDPDTAAALPELETFELPETVDKKEISQLIAHLQSITKWAANRETSTDFWMEYAETNWDSHFFDTLFALVEPSQQSLRERVWSEYANLGPLSQRAYLLIAALHQFSIPMKMEIVMRALDVPFSEFDREVLRSDARQILFSEYESSALNVYFRGRSRLISQIVFDRALATPGEQLPLFAAIVRNVNPSETFGLDELDALRTLLIQVLGPNGFDRRFAPSELSALFEEATARIQDDVLEHHYGLVEREAGRLLSARQHLENALQLSAALPYDLTSFRDSPQNIANSLATVIGALAQEALKRNDAASAHRLFSEAEQYFVSARSGAFPNTHAYHAHAHMLVTRARRLYERGTPERALALCEALDVLSEGLDNVNDDDRAVLIEVEASVMKEFGLGSTAAQEINARAKGAKPRDRARYELLLARHYVGDDKTRATRKDLRKAYAHAIRATEDDAYYFGAWKLRIELHSILHPKEWQEHLELLQKAGALKEFADNLVMLYELAVTQFTLANYAEAAKDFGKLRRKSAGHLRGVSTVELAGERGDADPFEFSGRVITLDKQSGYIKSEELATYGEILFFTRQQRFYTPRIGDEVAFTVGFTYKGTIALEMKKI